MAVKLLLFLALVIVPSFASAGALVTLEAYSGGCKVDNISPPNVSTTSWTSTFSNQKAVVFQNAATTPVYLGFVPTISSNTTSVALFNQGDSLTVELNENITVYFWGKGTGADIRALYCK